ncbi:MAG: hypothetical protein K9I95_14550 [Flavobacteriaceae bacterium]|nr:hypothetical protein [Flavobacteriaceae bacterium]
MVTSKKKHFDIPLILALLLMLIGFFIIFFPFSILDSFRIGTFFLDIDKYSELGEFIGGVTVPFFSGSAFILLYKTYTTQRKELNANRDFIIKQTTHIDKQQFETVYFKMINMHQLLANDVSFNFKGDLLHGKLCFKKFDEIMEEGNITSDKFFEFHKLYNEPFEVYINFFFHILNYLNNSQYLIPQDEVFYLEIFIASLTKSEAKLLSCYCQTINENNENSKVLIELQIKNKLNNLIKNK